MRSTMSIRNASCRARTVGWRRCRARSPSESSEHSAPAPGWRARNSMDHGPLSNRRAQYHLPTLLSPTPSFPCADMGEARGGTGPAPKASELAADLVGLHLVFSVLGGVAHGVARSGD